MELFPEGKWPNDPLEESPDELKAMQMSGGGYTPVKMILHSLAAQNVFMLMVI